MILFSFFFFFSKANAQFEYHKSQLNMKASSECPIENRGYTQIEQELPSYGPGNYYACNMKFRSKIEITQGLLLIHNCNFTFVTSDNGAIYINTPENTQESVEIHRCHFYRVLKGSIRINSKLQSNALNIINCTFEKCESSQDPYISCIYLTTSSGNIENCRFINNVGQKADIFYSNYGTEGRLIFKDNLFRRSDGSINGKGDLITIGANSYFDFIGNMISVSKLSGIVRLFSSESDLSNINNYKFERNSMFPSNSEIFGNKMDLIKDFFPETDIQCPSLVPPIGDSFVKDVCGSPFENNPSQAVVAIQSFVSIVYCTFNSINNSKSLKGGAVYILLNENMPVYDDPIRIYNSDFVFCNTLYGCAVYIESYQDLMKFDFSDCYFGNNFYNFGDAESRKNDVKGGAVYIKTKFSSFEFNRCSFFENKAGEGAGIYYLSETDSLEKENIPNEFSLHVIDCRFYHNEAYSNGAGIFVSISGYEHSKPSLVENCIFYLNLANEAEGVGDQPECGAGIYYHTSYTNHQSSTENGHELRVINCHFRSSIATYRGGAIYLLIENEEPSKGIEISQSYFRGNQLPKECFANTCPSGADIFFDFVSSKSSSNSQIADSILDINDCTFAFYKTDNDGGSISILIANQEPSKSIEIRRCEISSSSSNGAAKIGGAIYYNFSPVSTKDSTSNEKVYALHVVDCKFSANQVSDYGGSIAVKIEKREPLNPIEITGCTFVGGISGKNGGHIYYLFNSASSTNTQSNEHTLLINDCSFSTTVGQTLSANGGSIFIMIQNGEPSKSIEINNCTFTDCFVLGNGAAIYYQFSSTSSANTKTLLEDSNVYALNIVGCTFTSNIANNNGGAVGIIIDTQNPSNPIEFRGCKFNNNKANDAEYQDYEFGGAIYYVTRATSTLLDSNNYGFGIFDSEFNENEVSNYGGAISIRIIDTKPLNRIEISGCSFDKNKALTNDAGNGASLCYEIISTQSSSNKILEETPISLLINGCNFTENSATYFGDVFINTGQQSTIEFNACLFKDGKPDGVSLLSTDPSTLFHFNDCDFQTSSTVYFLSDVASAKIENCRFTDMTVRCISYITDSDSTTISESSEFRVENCNFTQNSEIVSLVHFVSPLMHQFYFISNNIDIKNEKTRALGANEGVLIADDGWNFENNTILPGRGTFIKTENAKNIPASCLDGFICSELPQCSDDMHCNFDATISGEDKPSITLDNLKFNGLNNPGNGAAIYVFNFHISCKEIHFNTCTSEKAGGGIYIYLDTIIDSPIELQNLYFNGCKAICGGAIYAYSSKVENKISILKSTFEANNANLNPEKDDDLYFGGSAIYLAAETATILRCKFNKNVGIGVKIINDFETLNLVKKSLKSQSSILIAECIFEAAKDSKSSIFYAGASKIEIPIDVNDCIFKGQLDKGFYHIESSENSNLHVKSCQFPDGMKSAVRKKSLILDSLEKIEKRSSFELKVISLILVGFACCAVIIAFFIHYRMNRNQNNDENNIEL